MADELDQTNKSEDSFEAKIELLHRQIGRLTCENSILQSLMERSTNVEGNHHSLNDQLTSAKKENDDLKSVNTLLTKRLQEREKDCADLGHRSYVLFQQAKSEHEKLNIEIKNLKLQTEEGQSEVQNTKLENDKLISELENVKLQKETSPSELDKLMVLYRCSEKEKSIASMKLLEAEENIRRLRNELHSLQSSIASKNETKRHKNDVNESESEKPDTFATESIEKRHKGLLEKEVIGKTDKLCEEFEAKFHEKRSYLITKLTSCDDQMQALKKLCEKLKEEKLKLVDLMEEVDGIMFKYRKQRECV